MFIWLVLGMQNRTIAMTYKPNRCTTIKHRPANYLMRCQSHRRSSYLQLSRDVWQVLMHMKCIISVFNCTDLFMYWLSCEATRCKWVRNDWPDRRLIKQTAASVYPTEYLFIILTSIPLSQMYKYSHASLYVHRCLLSHCRAMCLLFVCVLQH